MEKELRSVLDEAVCADCAAPVVTLDDFCRMVEVRNNKWIAIRTKLIDIFRERRVPMTREFQQAAYETVCRLMPGLPADGLLDVTGDVISSMMQQIPDVSDTGIFNPPTAYELMQHYLDNNTEEVETGPLPEDIKVRIKGFEDDDSMKISIHFVAPDFHVTEEVAERTINQTEYMAAIRALEICQAKKVRRVTICTKKLLVDQMNRGCRVSDGGLENLHSDLKYLVKNFDSVTFEYDQTRNKRARV